MDIIKNFHCLKRWADSLTTNLSGFLGKKRQVLSQIDKDLQLIVQSEYFDSKWYLQQYSDISQSNINPALHYLIYGGFEERNPSNAFSSVFYLRTHPELIASRINPLVHYLRSKSALRNSKTSLYLHVGLHKTGTSAIQKFLRRYADFLQEQGFYYPPDVHGTDAHHWLPSSMRQSGNLENLPQLEAWLKNCLLYCQAHDLSLLLSSEVFSEPIRYDVLARLLQSFDITVILYIRRQDLLIESVLNQILKDRQDIRPDDFWMDFDSMYVVDFEKRIEHWQHTFPDSKIILRRYGVASQKHPLEIDFLDALGVEPSCSTDWCTENVNPSLSLYEFIVLRGLAQMGFITSRTTLEQARFNLSEQIAKYQIHDVPMVGNYFNLEIRQRILDRYAASNERIRAKFFPEDKTLFAPLEPKPGLQIDQNMVSLLESELIQHLIREQSL